MGIGCVFLGIKDVNNISVLVERAQKVVESLDNLGLIEQKTMLINSIEQNSNKA
ncbi:hypothetical protein ACSVDA_14285 [Cytobacillus sp. Hm23]